MKTKDLSQFFVKEISYRYNFVYTFGTHISFDSMDEKFGNGKDSVLNKFADMDAQFGAFMNRVKKNPKFG